MIVDFIRHETLTPVLRIDLYCQFLFTLSMAMLGQKYMKQKFFYDRRISALDNYIDGNKIAPRLVEIRTDFARGEALKQYFSAKAETDFYLEDILNSFIALVQYPLNFAIFADVDGKLEFQFHFCSDKQHEARFISGLQDKNGKWRDFKRNSLFQLFPAVLDEQEFFIAVYHMDTKIADEVEEAEGFLLIRPEWTCFPADEDIPAQDAFDPLNATLSTSNGYIASCADYFFQFKWDVFDSEFVGFARHYLMTSITELMQSQRGWTDSSKQIQKFLRERDEYPVGTRDSWKEVLSQTFATVLRDSTNGMNLVTSMMKPVEDGHFGDSVRDYPPNMFLAFRTFSRAPDDGRNDKGNHRCYRYDTSFLISDGVREKFLTLLRNLRHEGQLAWEKSARSGLEFGKAFADIGRKRVLYRDFPNDLAGIEDNTLLESLDVDFWEMLFAEDGPERAVDILASWVGDDIRSFVDPAYHTGLIHTNHLFECGGLDRIGDLLSSAPKKIDEIDPKWLPDARRVLVMYYVLSELVGWEPPNGGLFDPSHLAVVLVPIKMRGSVWGVTIHGAYTPSYETVFADQRYWEAYFKLATDHRQKHSQIFDRYLWSLAEERVSELFLKVLAPEIREGGNPPMAFDDINVALRWEERNSPFAFPQFELSPEIPNHEDWLELPNSLGEPTYLVWEIVDNVFFYGHQTWNKHATRRFRQVIEHGVMRAITKGAEKGPQLVEN